MFNIAQQNQTGHGKTVTYPCSGTAYQPLAVITNYLSVFKIVPSRFPLNGFVHLDCLTIHVL